MTPPGLAAHLRADFGVCACVLQDRPDWGAELLRRAGAPRFLLRLARWQSRWAPSGIEPGGADWFTARAALGMRWPVRYTIRRGGDGEVMLAPATALAPRDLLRTALVLLALGGPAAALAALPLLALRQRALQRRVAQRYLPALAAYLLENAPPRPRRTCGS